MNTNMNQNDRRGFLSKMLVAGASGVALLSSSAFAGGKSGRNGGTAELDDDQRDRLFFIYQEEKVARDVYIHLGNEYPDESTFASIQLAEQRHMDAAQKLCENYGIDISMVDESDDGYGQFFVPYLDDLYKECLRLSGNTLPEALAVGVLVEETDIGTLSDTLDGEVGEMPADVINTYETLREGSYNHLESFEARLARV
ncbi:MAG: DUF2202 domain-containing protein [Campylobacterota bacterium]|nr:DUF2202 domain-containing protein [Campylobacterota bacterium]